MYAKYAISLSGEYANLQQAETYALRAEEIYNEFSNHFMWELAEVKFAQAQVFRWTDYNNALRLYKEACDLEPTNCYYMCTYSRRLIKNGRIEDAQHYYDLAVKVDPTYIGLPQLLILLQDNHHEQSSTLIKDLYNMSQLDK